jgi:hypothetical protein
LCKIISERRYNYFPPFLLITSFILFHPWAGGFPFNQTLFISVVLFLVMLLKLQFQGERKNL